MPSGVSGPSARYLKRLRTLCNRLPATAETASWGHPNFTAGGRIFASFETYRRRPCICIATSREEQAFLIDNPMFAVAPYVGGRGWVIAWLDLAPEWALLEDLLRKAHGRTLAAVPAKRPPRVAKGRAAAPERKRPARRRPTR